MNNEYVSIEHLCLTQYNSMRIESYADQVYIPYTAQGFRQAFMDAAAENPIILGKGSNIIFQKERIDTPVILTELMRKMIFADNVIICESGVSLSELAWFALEHNAAGFEFLEDIPGSVGGALCMNAGTYENTIGSLVNSVLVYDRDKDCIRTIRQEELASGWGKRDSCFQHNHWAIIQCTFKTALRGEYEQILNNILEIKQKRYLKQPRNYPSAGSVFKRPYIDGEPRYIWKLFEEAGLRGCRIGDAQVSEKHPGFIVNVGQATGKDVVDLMNHCKEVIIEKYGIRIEEEWKIV